MFETEGKHLLQSKRRMLLAWRCLESPGATGRGSTCKNAACFENASESFKTVQLNENQHRQWRRARFAAVGDTVVGIPDSVDMAHV